MGMSVFTESGDTQYAGCTRQTDCGYGRKPVRRDLAAHDSVQSWDASKLTLSMVKVISGESNRTYIKI